MSTYHKLMNITTVEFYIKIIYSDKVFRFTEIEEINPIPTGCILYKSTTGIGATHSELLSKRHSIIVLPHISIVTSKDKDCRNEYNINTLAIYGGIKENTVAEYLFNCEGYSKILTTPKGPLVAISKVKRWCCSIISLSFLSR